jgi:diketogulonate reductase-like aldo/keto reductase
MVDKIPVIELASGKTLPVIGLGLWKNIIPSHVDRAVESALEAGYTHFDSAQIYKNESSLKKALINHGAKREKVFITTKIWNGNQGEDKFEKSLEKSLSKIGGGYVDLLLLHFPVTETRRGAWRRMEQAYKDGKAKSIGVSNYTISHLEELLKECEIKPMVNQVELHVFLQQPELLAYCEKNKIIVEAYSPLAHGYGLDNPTLKIIANKHNKTTAQIMLRWCLQMNTVILPKSTHKDRIQENINVFDFKLDADDIEKIRKLDENKRTCWDPTNTP